MAALCWAATALAQEKAVQERVAKLLTVLADYRGDTDLQMAEGTAARRELTEIGAAAAPQLIDAVLTHPPNSGRGFAAGKALAEIGKPALPAIRARWPDLNDERRWRLVLLIEKHDPGSVKEYAYNCLDAEGPAVRAAAWGFVVWTKDLRSQERYFALMSDGSKVLQHYRLGLLPGDKPVYDEKRENDLLIDLLRPDSWVAKGEGQIPPPGFPSPWWPDGRPVVIRTLHTRKVARAAPALLDVLTEKGPGAGYLAKQVIPVLADFGYKDAVPELERIAASKPGPGRSENVHPHTGTGWKAVRQLAADAIKRLNEAKP